MSRSRIMQIIAMSALCLSACNSSENNQELTSCSVTEPCSDANMVCVNQYCVPKCTPNSCPTGQLCGENGICTFSPTDQPECSDDNPCAGDLVCSEGKCIPNQTQPECSDDNPCAGDLVCVNEKCVECSEQKACQTGKKCDAGKCVVDPDYHDGLCVSSEDCVNEEFTCQDGKCIAKCKSSDECEGNTTVCDLNGQCTAACNTGYCPEGMVCEGRIRICVPGECSWYDDCKEGKVCDLENHRCLDRCSAGSCESGKVCDSEGFCVSGECSKIDNTCADPNKACDAQNMKCIEKCISNDSCEQGKLCDVTGLCVSPCKAGSCEDGYACMPTGLCVKAECSVIDACDISYKTCVDNKCIDKCKSNKDCSGNAICDKTSGICQPKCTANSCNSGEVCSDGVCVTGTCSEMTPCPANEVCTAEFQCVPAKLPDNECFYYRNCGSCDDTEEKCISKCMGAEDALTASLNECQADREKCTNDYTTCETNKTRCDEDAQETYARLQDSCKNVISCEDLKKTLETQKAACLEAKNTCQNDESSCTQAYDSCISEAENAFNAKKSACESNKCIDEKTLCIKNLTECEKRNKRCPEGKQCNAYNQCIDIDTADGLGLGEICDDGLGNSSKCASDMICHKAANDTQSYCIPAAYSQDRKPCTAGAFKDTCEGNIIVECDESTGLILVQNCKTDYINMSEPTTGIFHGENFFCLKRPGTRYVTCAEQCSEIKSEKHICGWDIDDTDIDFSDRYVCQYNQDGISAFFPVDSEICASTCEYTTGYCD